MQDEQDSGYEKSDVNLKMIFGLTVVLLVILVGSIVAINELFMFSKEHMVYKAILQPESAAIRELRAKEDQLLENYAVIDAEKRIYQIPVERAMELMANEAFDRAD